jgi:hypothetical protein
VLKRFGIWKLRIVKGVAQKEDNAQYVRERQIRAIKCY